MDLISVIVPVYNAEKFLGRCLTSIIRQTYNNLQIILINDGSVDNSEAVCKEYMASDKRIEYIRQDNAGQAVARNRGLDIAKGTYVVFVDADDYVDKQYIETMYRLIIDNHADMAVCSFIRTYGFDTENVLNKSCKHTIYNGKELIRNMYNLNVQELAMAWNKMFRLNVFENEKFPAGKVHEDFVLMTKLMYQAEKVAYTTQPLYYYYQSSDSTTRKKFTLKRLDCISEIERKLAFFEDMQERQLYGECLCEYELMTLKYCYLCKRDIKDSGREQAQLMDKYKYYMKILASEKGGRFLKRIYIYIGFLFPGIMGWLANKIIQE